MYMRERPQSLVPIMTSRRTSDDVELVSVHSGNSEVAPFPSFYRRENAVKTPTTKEFRKSSADQTSSEDDDDDSAHHGKVQYAPMPEHRKLGYFSTSALIVSKMIGTGVFAKPSTVFGFVGGKGLALFLWVACGLMSLAGLLMYVELGVAFPFSGAEVVYVEECYPHPRYLAVIVISLLFVLLTHFAGNCISFAQLIIQAFQPDNPNPDDRLEKFVAVVMLSAVCLLHLFSRKMGIAVNNFLAIYKVSLVTFIILVGFAAMAGGRGKGVTGGGTYGMDNWKGAMNTKTMAMSDYANAILGVLWAYTGWENANYVLSEVRRPPGKESRVFRVAAFSAIGTTTVLYVLANVAYFTVLDDEELLAEGDIVAAKFFTKVFGDGWFVQRGFKVIVALSILGNFISSTYGLARVKQEIAKLRILPFSQFFAKQSHYDTPVGALVLHWSVAMLFIVCTPPNKDGQTYDLITNLFIYGQNWMIICVTLGVIAMKYQPRFRHWKPAILPWKAILVIISIYVPLNVFIIILTWWPPHVQPEIPSYVTPGVATGIIVCGFVYWFGFAKVAPALGYHIDSEPDELVDGSRIVTYKRYKTGFAKKMSDWLDRYIRKRNKE